MILGKLIFINVGFGLLTTYINNTGKSGLGFVLLIAAISVQLYLLVNIFFTKLQIQPTNESFAFACAISIYVAYAAVHGRVGALQVFFITIFGVIGKYYLI
jgi:hypothetical protein